MDFQTQAIKNSAQAGAYNFEDSHKASPAVVWKIDTCKLFSRINITNLEMFGSFTTIQWKRNGAVSLFNKTRIAQY